MNNEMIKDCLKYFENEIYSNDFNEKLNLSVRKKSLIEQLRQTSLDFFHVCLTRQINSEKDEKNKEKYENIRSIIFDDVHKTQYHYIPGILEAVGRAVSNAVLLIELFNQSYRKSNLSGDIDESDMIIQDELYISGIDLITNGDKSESASRLVINECKFLKFNVEVMQCIKNGKDEVILRFDPISIKIDIALSDVCQYYKSDNKVIAKRGDTRYFIYIPRKNKNRDYSDDVAKSKAISILLSSVEQALNVFESKLYAMYKHYIAEDTGNCLICEKLGSINECDPLAYSEGADFSKIESKSLKKCSVSRSRESEYAYEQINLTNDDYLFQFIESILSSSKYPFIINGILHLKLSLAFYMNDISEIIDFMIEENERDENFKEDDEIDVEDDDSE